MIPVIEQQKAAVAELCRRYRVQRLYVFGSAVESCFDAQRSDLDFLVKMADREPTGGYADRVLDLAEGLERLFKRRVDLVTEESIRNPYFRQHVEASRQLIYGQLDQEALLDAVEAGRSIQARCTGRAFAEYEGDRWFRRTVEREFEIIGEALNRLSQVAPGVAAAISELPRIVGFRNRIIHGYDTVDDATIWGVVGAFLGALPGSRSHLG